MKTAFIIQARTGSSRFPKKTVLPFYKDKSVTELLIERLENHFGKENIILATTTSSDDNLLEQIAKRYEIKSFRGSEMDVLKRFTEAAITYGYDRMVRINADNPFLEPRFIKPFLESLPPETDYASYKFDDGTPAILSHTGLFAEFVTLKALEKIAVETQDVFYREHVTNYIYLHPEKFHLHWFSIPHELQKKNYRLTLDTKQDFELLKKIYTWWKSSDHPDDIYFLISEIQKNASWLKKMQDEMERNKK